MTTDIIANSIQAGVGCAYDQKENQLYFVEYGAGTLKRINLYSPYTIQTIASGFSHPEDVFEHPVTGFHEKLVHSMLVLPLIFLPPQLIFFS